jgi:multidrug efflux pump subunit AcrA (membrane-fusion protein)
MFERKATLYSAIVIGVFACLMLFGCAAKQEAPAESAPVVTVDVAPVLTSTIQLKVGGDALLYPIQQAAIVPKISAPVTKFYVEKGSHVRSGQLLAELENKDLVGAVAENKAAYDQAEAAYETTARATVPEEVQKAELDVKAAKDTLDAQQKVYDNRQALYREGAIAQRDVNDAAVSLTQAQNQYQIAKTHLEGLKGFATAQSMKIAAAQRDAAKARYDTTVNQLSYARITSPIDGVVTDRPLFAGEMPPSGGPLITVMDLSQVIARAHISQADAAQLKVGNVASLFGAEGTAPLPGKVTLISPALDPSNTTVEVWIQAANPGERLKPGSSLHVEAVAQTAPNALVIPVAAVLTSQAGNTSVMVIDSENKPHKKGVTLGIHDGGNVQIAQGLQSGERVVTLGAFELSKLDQDVLDKTTVQIQPPKEEEEEDEQ